MHLACKETGVREGAKFIRNIQFLCSCQQDIDTDADPQKDNGSYGVWGLN